MTTTCNDQRCDGFTLVELLVVMVVISVLAAIAIPVVNGQRTKARQATVKADVTQIVQEIATFAVEDDTGSLSLTTGASPTTWQLARGASVVATGSLSPGNSVGANGTVVNASNFCVAVVSNHAGVESWRATAGGVGPGTCPA